MPDAPDLRRLLHILAVHPVFPPAEALPPNDEAFRTLLADLAQGERSTRAETLRAVADELFIPAEELARRAEFLMACLVLPASGTYYDLLGVAPDASPQEIRKRWAGLIQRYHPDRVGGASGWLDGQARRLIEAYQTLKDPDRRREYDRQLALSSPLPPPGRGPGEGIAWLRRARLGRGWAGPVSSRWRWAPVGILAVGVALGVWAYTRPVPRLPQSAPVPPAPSLLEVWRQIESGRDTTALTRSGGAERETGSTASRSPSGVARSEPVELPSLKDRVPVSGAPSLPLPSVGKGRGEGAPPPPPAASAPERPTPATRAGRVEPAPSPEPPKPLAASPGTPSVVAATPAAPTPLSPEPGGPVQPSKPAAVSPPAPPPAPVAAGPASPTPGIAEASPTRASEAAPPTARPSVPPPIPVPAPVTAAAKPEPPPAPVAAAKPSAPPVPRDEPLALVDAFRRAYERKDLRAVMGFLGAQPRDGSLLGRGPIEQQYARTFATLDSIRYELADLDVRGGATVGDVVVQGRFRIRATRVQPASPFDVGGPIRWTLRREGGALRIVGIAYELASR